MRTTSIRLFSSAAVAAALCATLGAQQTVRVSDTGAMVKTWTTGNDELRAAVSRDGGSSWVGLPEPNYNLNWRTRSFDPKNGDPGVPANLLANESNELFYVQFVTDIIGEYATAMESLGADVTRYYPNQAYIVRIARDRIGNVSEQPYVRTVLEMQVGHKLDEEIQARLLDGTLGTARYNIMLVEKQRDAASLETRIEEIGGVLESRAQGGILVGATLDPDQLRQIAHENTVLWIDPYTEPEYDVDNARIQGGINYVETVAGIDGKGIRGSLNEGVHEVHPEFAALPPFRTGVIPFGSNGASSHGTNTAGIIYAQGLTGGVKGILPFAQMIESNSVNNRYPQANELTSPTMPFQAMMQTQSWGGGRTFNYTSKSAELDDALFDFDHLFSTQSQSNAGNQDSRPEAWAKNVVGVGGFLHRNNANPSDDCWCNTGSTGPAQDGRVGVSFAAYYDSIRTTQTSGSYSNSFGGTSGATPIINGLSGAALQIFTDGHLGYPAAQWDERFDANPNLTTTRVMLAVCTRQLSFTGTNRANRVQQGWGFPNIQDLYDNRNNILLLDEEDVLSQGETRDYYVWVKPSTPELRASMHHLEDEAVPSAIPTRINSLDLVVDDLNGTTWLGNGNGILDGPWSAPGGSANDVDIHENVFIQNPASGVYKVSVSAPAVRADSHKETAAVDADFALAIRGIGGGRDRSGMTLDMTSAATGDLQVTAANLPGSGWSYGITMFSFDTARYLSLGDTFGVQRDNLSASIIRRTPAAGSVFSFTSGGGAGQYPNATFVFPSALATNVSGQTLDAVIVLFDASGNIVDVSNAARVAVQ